MKCQICGSQHDSVALLNEPWPAERTLELIACLPCATGRDSYCVKHQRPKVGSGDGTFFCLDCANEECAILDAAVVWERFESARMLPSIETAVGLQSGPIYEMDDLVQRLRIAVFGEVDGESLRHALLRFVVIKQLRLKQASWIQTFSQATREGPVWIVS